MTAKRVFLVVLDSLGAGEAPDAAAFGDLGANTLRSIRDTGLLRIPTPTLASSSPNAGAI